MRALIGISLGLLFSLQCHAATIFTNVTIFDPATGEAIEHVAVQVDGGRIIAITSDAAPRPMTDDLTIIDGTDKFLIPGLTEMHGHLPPASWGKEQTEETLFLYLAGGVTTVRGMLGDPGQFAMRDRINSGEIAGPTLYLAAPSLNGSSVSSVEEAVEKTKRYAAEGWDLQKIHPGLTRAEYDAMAKTANDVGYPFGGHVPSDVGIERALSVGQISIDHMDGYISWLDGDDHALTEEELQRAIQITLDSGTWIVPTQALFNTFYSSTGGGTALTDAEVQTLLDRPENAYVPKRMLAQWHQTAQSARPSAMVTNNRQRLLKAFAGAGVNLAMGSDAPQTFSVPGFSIWREIEVMIDAGLTPEQILDIGTAAPGRYFMEKDQFGTITVGARADLILLDADPSEDALNITKQAGVMAAGRWYSRVNLDRRLAEIAARHAN